MNMGEQIANEQLPLKHSDGSDCIGCSPPPRLHRQVDCIGPPPRLRRQAAVVDLEASSEDLEDSAFQSQGSLDASDSLLPSIPEDEEEAMANDPDKMSLYENALRVKEMLDEAESELRWRKGKSHLN